MSTDPALDQLRAALAKPSDAATAGSFDPRKPRLRAAAREAYVAKQEPSLDDPHYEAEMNLRAMQAIHLVVGPLNGVGIRAGGWIACDPNDALPSVPMTRRTRDQRKATCADCLSAVDSA